MEKSIYVTDGSFEGILTAVFEAYQSREEPRFIVCGNEFQMELGSKIVNIDTDQAKAQRVCDAIRKKISQEAYEILYRAYLSERVDVGGAIFRYIRIGLKIGKGIVSYLQNPDVLLINDLSQKVSKETHLFLGILRFRKLSNGIFYSRIEPDNNIIMLIVGHFAERLSDQPWIIHDARREIFALYNTDEVILTNDSLGLSIENNEIGEFELLWKAYFHSIAIESRKNLKLQKQFMPRRYWKNMIEKL